MTHQIDRALLEFRAGPEVRKRDDRPAATDDCTGAALEVCAVEEAEREAFLRDRLRRQPFLRYPLEIVEQRCHLSRRHDFKRSAVTHRLAMRLAERRSLAAVERKGGQRDSRLLAELRQRQARIDVQRQRRLTDLVEHRPRIVVIAQLLEPPHEILLLRARANGIAHRDPAAAGRLVHHERGARFVEEQSLVAEQHEAGLRLARSARDRRRECQIVGRSVGRSWPRGPQQPPEPRAPGEQHDEQARPQHPRRIGVARKLPPQLVAIRHVPIREQTHPDGGTDRNRNRDGPGRRESLPEQ